MTNKDLFKTFWAIIIIVASVVFSIFIKGLGFVDYLSGYVVGSFTMIFYFFGLNCIEFYG